MLVLGLAGRLEDGSGREEASKYGLQIYTFTYLVFYGCCS